MSDQTKQALEQFVQKMLAGAEQAGNFAVEQSPLLVQEWLAWQMWSSGVLVIGLAIAAGVFAGCARWGWRQDEPEPFIVSFFACFLCGGFCIYNTFAFIKVVVAPRVVILEKFMDLVK